MIIKINIKYFLYHQLTQRKNNLSFYSLIKTLTFKYIILNNLIIFITLTNLLFSQDTLKINLKQADSIFISKNFYLLAATMNIEAQKAQIIQAKLYPNPVFTADLNVYDPVNNKFFHAGQSGQKSFQFEQLIILGGKRKSEIQLANTNVKIAELEFEQLIRQLKFRLHSDLFAIGQQQNLLSRYNSQLSLLNTLLTTFQTQADKGNIPLKDVVRLKGAYLKLNNDRAELFQKYYESLSNIQTLLQSDKVIDFQFTEQDVQSYVKLNSLADIKTEALKNKPELLIIQQDKILAEQFLQYQKRLVTPDINLFTSYDQRGGAFNNQINFGISIPIPIWNRNQGNIKSYKFKVKEAEINLQAIQNEILINIQNNYALYTQTISEYKKAIFLYNDDFEVTVKGMIQNFQKQNVSIVEFVDFFEAYNEVLTELTRIKTQLVLSGEQLNLLIGKDIY